MDALKTEVIILSKGFRIEGKIDLLPKSRLTDFMNKSKKCIVVTDAMVSSHSKKEILKAEFMNVLVKNIEIILPADSIL